MTGFRPPRVVQAISHLNVSGDDIEAATEFYGAVLGFAPASNDGGPMDYGRSLARLTASWVKPLIYPRPRIT